MLCVFLEQFHVLSHNLTFLCREMLSVSQKPMEIEYYRKGLKEVSWIWHHESNVQSARNAIGQSVTDNNRVFQKSDSYKTCSCTELEYEYLKHNSYNPTGWLRRKSYQVVRKVCFRDVRMLIFRLLSCLITPQYIRHDILCKVVFNEWLSIMGYEWDDFQSTLLTSWKRSSNSMLLVAQIILFQSNKEQASQYWILT